MANQGERKSEEAKRPTDAANDLSKAQEEGKHRRYEYCLESTLGLLPWPVSCLPSSAEGDPLMANLHGTFRAGRAGRPHSPAISSRASKSTEKVERSSSGKDGCWCGVVCARLLLDRGRVEVSFQGLEKDRLSRGLRAFRSAGEPLNLFPGARGTGPD